MGNLYAWEFCHTSALFQSFQVKEEMKKKSASPGERTNILILQSDEMKRKENDDTYHWMIGLDPVLYLPGWRRTDSSHHGDNNISSGPQACALVCLLQPITLFSSDIKQLNKLNSHWTGSLHHL